MGFDAGSLIARLQLDTTEFTAELEKAKAEAAKLNGSTITPKVTLDTAEFDLQDEEVTVRKARLRKKVDIPVNLDVAGLPAEIALVEAEMKALSSALSRDGRMGLNILEGELGNTSKTISGLQQLGFSASEAQAIVREINSAKLAIGASAQAFAITQAIALRDAFNQAAIEASKAYNDFFSGIPRSIGGGGGGGALMPHGIYYPSGAGLPIGGSYGSGFSGVIGSSGEPFAIPTTIMGELPAASSDGRYSFGNLGYGGFLGSGGGGGGSWIPPGLGAGTPEPNWNWGGAINVASSDITGSSSSKSSGWFSSMFKSVAESKIMQGIDGYLSGNSAWGSNLLGNIAKWDKSSTDAIKNMNPIAFGGLAMGLSGVAPIIAGAGLGAAGGLLAGGAIAGGGFLGFAGLAKDALGETMTAYKGQSQLQALAQQYGINSQVYQAAAQQYATSTAGMNPLALSTATQMLPLMDQFTTAMDKIETPIFGAIVNFLKGLDSALPALIPFLKAATGVMTGFMNTISKGISGPGFANFMKQMTFFEKPIMKDIGKIILNLAGAFGSFLVLFAPVGVRLFNDLTNLSKGFANFVKHAQFGPGFLKAMTTVSTDLENIGGAIVTFVKVVGKASAPIGLSILNFLGSVAPLLKTFFNDIPDNMATTLAALAGGIILVSKAGTGVTLALAGIALLLYLGKELNIQMTPSLARFVTGVAIAIGAFGLAVKLFGTDFATSGIGLILIGLAAIALVLISNWKDVPVRIKNDLDLLLYYVQEDVRGIVMVIDGLIMAWNAVIRISNAINKVTFGPIFPTIPHIPVPGAPTLGSSGTTSYGPGTLNWLKNYGPNAQGGVGSKQYGPTAVNITVNAQGQANPASTAALTKQAIAGLVPHLISAVNGG